jgi:hypothetical protein
MNYVYDILLNFKEDFMDFYDWNNRDSICHIRKIPIYKVETKVLKDFLNFKIELSSDELLKLENQTEIFLGRKVKTLKYACLITDSRKVIAFKVKDNKVYISDLLIDEEASTLEMINLLSFWDIKYKIIEKKENNILKTRKQIEFEKYLNIELEKILNEKNLSKLKYIYYECFDKKEDKIDIIIDKIKTELKENYSVFSKKIDYLLKITM